MNKDTTRQYLNILGVVIVIVFNILANALPLNGLNTGEISDRFDVYFVPAGYVFSIWGLIYLGLLGFAAYQALPSQKENPRLRRIGYLFLGSCLANIVWLFLWHYELFPLTLLAMLILLGLLLGIYLNLGVGKEKVPTAERWLVHLPFSIYLGWITVATVANVTALLDFLKWNGWGISEQAWTVIILAAVLIITWAVSLTRKDIAYALVIIWAVTGIAVKHAATQVVALVAWITAALVLLGIAYSWLRKKA